MVGGEQPLSDYSSCLLGSLNLSEFVVDPFTENATFDMIAFKNAIRIVVRAMDDVLEENIDRLPLEKQKDKARNWRQIGIGQMGLADMFIKMGMTYGDRQSLALSEMIAKTLINEAMKTTALLAKERGTFPKYDYNSLIKSEFYNENIYDDIKKLVEEYGMRNCALLSVAPTGTIGTFLETSTGIEPNFRFKYTRKTESLGNQDEYYDVYAKIAKEYQRINDTKELPPYFIESDMIKPIDRIKMQSTWQKYIDTAISSTVNLPEEATVEDIENIYIDAWKYGLKGITVFRNNCERMGILTTDKKEEEEVKELRRGEWKSLADDTYYVKRSIAIGCGKLKLFIGYSPSEQTIQDLYIVKSGQGGCEKNLQAIAIAMSALLRVGGNLGQLEKAFSGITPCPSFVSNRAKGIKLSTGNYCGMAIINEVKAFLREINSLELPQVKNEQTEIIDKEKEEKTDGLECPECHQKTLTMSGGCNVCTNCGYSKCS